MKVLCLLYVVGIIEDLFGVHCVTSFFDCYPQRRNVAGILELHITGAC